jgi:hypothetical protein
MCFIYQKNLHVSRKACIFASSFIGYLYNKNELYMKKMMMSAALLVAALTFSGVANAQDNKKADCKQKCEQVEKKDCCKDKKNCCNKAEAGKKECCKSAEAGKKECCKKAKADKKDCKKPAADGQTGATAAPEKK